MRTLTNSEISKLSNLEKAFLILIVEKFTGKRYDLVHLKKGAVIGMCLGIREHLTKKGNTQLDKIFKKLNINL
jgi:hypothetical protein